jgi:hypothetical protein
MVDLPRLPAKLISGTSRPFLPFHEAQDDAQISAMVPFDQSVSTLIVVSGCCPASPG